MADRPGRRGNRTVQIRLAEARRAAYELAARRAGRTLPAVMSRVFDLAIAWGEAAATRSLAESRVALLALQAAALETAPPTGEMDVSRLHHCPTCGGMELGGVEQLDGEDDDV